MKEIADASYRYQREVDEGVKTVVGVNRYVMKEGARPETLRIDETVERQQLARLSETRERRDAAAVARALEALAAAGESGGNLIPPILDAVRRYATVGEISGALVPVFGRYREVPVL